jgi:NAD(P)-dependent dehydrogenase (short-subunit alcohol dehydrogenase family)
MAGEVEIFAANAGDADAGERAVSATIERFGGLDILVNNAATNPYYGRTLEVDKGRYDKTFQVNLEAPLLWCRAAWDQAFKDSFRARSSTSHRSEGCARMVADSASTTSRRQRSST